MPDHFSSQRMPQLPAASARLVLWERTRPWSRFFLNQVRQTPSLDRINPVMLADRAICVATLDELRETIDRHPASFVFAEVSVANFRELPGQIPRLRSTKPRLSIAVVCFELPEQPIDEYHILDSLFHEAGATAVLAAQRDLLAMIPAVLTHFAALEQPETHWRDLIEQRLPWRNVGQNKPFSR